MTTTPAARDENKEFNSWRKEQIASLIRMGYPDAARAFNELGSVQWAGWQARSALSESELAELRAELNNCRIAYGLLRVELDRARSQEPVAFYWQDTGHHGKHGPFFGVPSAEAAERVGGRSSPVFLYERPMMADEESAMSEEITGCGVPSSDYDAIARAEWAEWAEKDAERYRWLRLADWRQIQACVIRNPKHQAKLGSDCPSRDRLDQFIDDAMSAEKDSKND